MREGARQLDIETARLTLLGWSGALWACSGQREGLSGDGTCLGCWNGGSELETTTATSGARDRGIKDVSLQIHEMQWVDCMLLDPGAEIRV